VSFRGHSDTEVLLQLYLAEGEQMLTRLNGIFAFAIWDGRDRITVRRARRLGVKPLYYAAIDRGFAFASEIKALVRLVPDVRALDPLALHRYLTFLWCPARHAVQGGAQASAWRGDPGTGREDRTLLVLVPAPILPSRWRDAG
jgi:asparagine synthetase B (glutamine-hydrolysing)